MKLSEEAIAYLDRQRTLADGRQAEDVERDVARTSAMLGRTFESVLDIGCGIGLTTMALARELEPKVIYGMDGDGDDPIGSGWKECRGPWNQTRLTRETWDANGCSHIGLLKIGEPPPQRFELITSYLACGFHFPLTTYPLRDWLTDDGVLAVDIRSWAGKDQLEGWEVLDSVKVDRKRIHMILRAAR